MIDLCYWPAPNSRTCAAGSMPCGKRFGPRIDERATSPRPLVRIPILVLIERKRYCPVVLQT